eukprot:gene6208-7730_t
MVSGCGAGAMASLVTTPLDVIKTTMQVSTKNRSVLSTYKNLLENPGGVRNLYIGLKPTLLGLVPTWSIYFATYSSLKEGLAKSFNTDNSNSFIHLLSAIAAGATTSTITNPIWVVKTRLITQEMRGRQKRYTGVFQCFFAICKEEGFKGLYKGLGPSLLGVLHVGVQLPLYEQFKIVLQKKNKNQKLGLTDIMVASSLSKIVASIVAYPHEVLRSRLQDSSIDSPYKYKGSLIQMFKQIFHEEGIRGLYKGMGINLLRVTPQCVITFTSYELIKKYLESLYGFSSEDHH